MLAKHNYHTDLVTLCNKASFLVSDSYKLTSLQLSASPKIDLIKKIKIQSKSDFLFRVKQ